MSEQRQGLEWILRLKWGCTKDVCCHLFFFAMVVDVVTEFTKESALSELLYAGDLILMIETTREIGIGS